MQGLSEATGATQICRTPARAVAGLLAVDLWVFSLGVAPAGVSASCLDAVEQERASRFLDPVHARRFLHGRMAVRNVLADRLGVSADKIRFKIGPRGKPALQDHEHLKFSMSGSGDVGAVAVAEGAELGVDVEEIRHIDAQDLAQRYFSTAENAALGTCDASARLVRFFHLWTLKEAVVKATGAGLLEPIDGFSIELSSNAAPLLTSEAADFAGSWRLVQFDPGPGCAGALAVRTGRSLSVTKRNLG